MHALPNGPAKQPMKRLTLGWDLPPDCLNPRDQIDFSLVLQVKEVAPHFGFWRFIPHAAVSEAETIFCYNNVLIISLSQKKKKKISLEPPR